MGCSDTLGCNVRDANASGVAGSQTTAVSRSRLRLFACILNRKEQRVQQHVSTHTIKRVSEQGHWTVPTSGPAHSKQCVVSKVLAVYLRASSVVSRYGFYAIS